MNATLLAFIAVGLYSLGTFYQALNRFNIHRSSNLLALGSGVLAVVFQALALFSIANKPDVDLFSVVNSASLITCIGVIIFIVVSTKHPTQSMLFLMYPAAIASTFALLITDPKHNPSQLEAGILSHITLSILAYSVLSLAAIQAILVVYRNHQLKNHQKSKISIQLPPLLTMESILFDLLRIGTIFLAGAIVLGFIFVENLFAQHLAHKTFFSLISFTLYATLLLGREVYGWRGSLAASITLWGTGALMLGFFGTKLVLEAML